MKNHSIQININIIRHGDDDYRKASAESVERTQCPLINSMIVDRIGMVKPVVQKVRDKT